MTDLRLRPPAHPAAVIARIRRQPSRAAPMLLDQLTARFGIDRRLAGEARRDLDHRFADHHRDGVEVAGVRLQSQALRFQRDAAAAGERVEQRRRPAFRRDSYQLAGGSHGVLVGGVFPFDQPLDEVEEPHAGAVAFGVDVGALGQLAAGLGEVRVGMGVVGVVHQRGEDDGAGCRQGPPRPPQMQGGGVAVADGLFAGAGGVDGFQRQRHFNQLLGSRHGTPPFE